ncbi:MAG: hypothetical protein AAGE59_10710 [Cyanobacteria bacterium P01_F01_bin.86]
MTDTKAITLNPESTTPNTSDHVATTYADRLMDELFGGIERALEGDLEALEKPAKPAEVDIEDKVTHESELTLSFSEGGLPAVLLAEQSNASPIHVSDTSAATLPFDATMLPPINETIASPPKGWKRYLTVNRTLLGAAGLVAIATAALWLGQRQTLPLTASAPASSPASAPAPHAHAEFLEYLRRSLDVISQKVGEVASAPTSTGSDVAVALNNGALGLPPVGNSTLPPSSGLLQNPGSLNVIERVYIPYQASPQVPPTPLSLPRTGAVPALVPGNPQATVPSSAAVAAPTHTLMGVLELGDRSAALFEIDGVSQRVYIGEPIANSGWSLVSVANEEAVIRRNGEVRSIYIGQQF